MHRHVLLSAFQLRWFPPINGQAKGFSADIPTSQLSHSFVSPKEIACILCKAMRDRYIANANSGV